MNLIPSDFELVDQLQKGDKEAFDQIYERYSMKLYCFALKYLKSVEEAEELVQSVFLKIWGNYRNLKKESSLKSYIFTIAYNDICKLFRKKINLQKYIDYNLAENTQSSFEIEDKINYQAVLDRVQNIVDKLPEKQKAIFLKSRIEGKSTKEIADELNLSPGTVDNYISEILKFVRSQLPKDDLSLLLLFALFLL